MSSFTNSKKADAQPSLSTSTSNDAADGENKTAAAQSANERPSYHTENIGSTPSSRRAPEDVANRNQNASGSSPPRRVAWTAVRTHPSGEASFTKYLDDGAFVASGSRPTPPPAPEPFKAAEFPTQRDEELMEKGEKLELHDGKGHGDVVDEVVYKGRGKAGGKEVGGVGSKGDKVGEKKQETVAGKKKFGSFNAMLYGPPAVDGNNEKK
ncbi:unnamed protein product [Zymoseptoria tritici ST99CH_1A5]|uniref:Uncharacterized protein n=3 Tax=Zymoseptoria tritici TaxID=1047171 RepID=F9XF51_ZYMTI|nr:uncharacterized protein MYCGRDRAFT_94780 [Zymoseptoria tritici IPO323]EGP85863.1 hypothetical protein MYCGRDRAFT_94780 [Zymoseptoria tritici IPO323]SMQ52885.1 unnamed protein product [Zymoseptoria tritici ST99CH_3D7]SMR58085.1 unnamed protein product [Zymoseptoria tritici ST99CH_3D1]SMY26521.1 unnamed protein product [Zymoseptoria tritici ST99CH_1A5]